MALVDGHDVHAELADRGVKFIQATADVHRFAVPRLVQLLADSVQGALCGE